MLEITPTGQACGATVNGVDLRGPLDAVTVGALRSAWLEHHVLVFPDQNLNDDQLESFSLNFGPFGDDPFIAPIAGREHVIAIERRADETSSLFAEGWHTDWSFQAHPPAGTCLYGIIIPPHGGHTLFANQHMALEQMPADLRARLEDKVAIHSAGVAYAPEGLYGEGDAPDRSMDIRPSADASKTHPHPLIRKHPETGRLGIFGTAGYLMGIEGMDQNEAFALIMELAAWQTRPEFVYTHTWAPGMLVMWDNRSVLHRATGGYEGFDRLLHRTTIGASEFRAQ